MGLNFIFSFSSMNVILSLHFEKEKELNGFIPLG